MKVINELKCYEVNDEKIEGLVYPILKVESHWNDTNKVVLRLLDGRTYTLIARDLIKAINNATNHGN